MKKAVTLTVQAREEAKKPKDLRKAGLVPCVVYGSKAKNQSVQCDAKAFHKAYVSAGSNTVVEVEVGGKKVPCLIHAVALDPVTGNYEHIDFYAVDMTKKVTTHVPIVVQGEAPAVKNLGGVMLTVHDELEVTCLPGDIPESFVIDVSGLENFHDAITVASVKVPSGVTVTNNPETVLITIQEPRKEEEIAPPVPAEGAEGEAQEGAEGAAEGEAGEKKEGDEKPAAEKKEEKK